MTKRGVYFKEGGDDKEKRDGKEKQRWQRETEIAKKGKMIKRERERECVCVCVWERERERDCKERDEDQERERLQREGITKRGEMKRKESW